MGRKVLLGLCWLAFGGVLAAQWLFDLDGLQQLATIEFVVGLVLAFITFNAMFGRFMHIGGRKRTDSPAAAFDPSGSLIAGAVVGGALLAGDTGVDPSGCDPGGITDVGGIDVGLGGFDGGIGGIS